MRIELNIAPVSKSRPRFNTYTGRTYTDNKTREFEETVGYLYKLKGGEYFDDKFIKVKLEFIEKVPKSYSKKKTDEALKGIIRPTKRDIDNMCKSVLDGLLGIAYKDDRIICELSSSKHFGIKDKVVIEIEEI